MSDMLEAAMAGSCAPDQLRACVHIGSMRFAVPKWHVLRLMRLLHLPLLRMLQCLLVRRNVLSQAHSVAVCPCRGFFALVRMLIAAHVLTLAWCCLCMDLQPCKFMGTKHQFESRQKLFATYAKS